MRKFTSVFFVLMLCALTSIAQQKTLKGKVVEKDSDKPIESATISLTNGKKVATDANGVFVVNAAENTSASVVASGYLKKSINLVEGITISLEPDPKSNLTDVVVVAFGSQKRANVTSSLVQIKQEDLLKRQVATTSNLLQGLAPGVVVQQQSGKPGSDQASIRIRGIGSITSSSAPMYIVDGVETSFDNIDPNAIESITILKDAAATAIYGNRASNGVVLVKTKRASGKGLKVGYNFFVTKQQATAIPERLGAVEHMELSNLAEQNRTLNPNAVVFPQTLIDKYKTTGNNNLDVINTDWTDLLFTNNGLMQNHNVTLSSGGERFNIFTSLSYLKQNGITPNNSFEKYDLRFNPDFKLRDNLTLAATVAYTNAETINPSTGSSEFIIRQAIGLPAIGAGKFPGGLYGNAGQSNNRNPLAMAEAAGTSVGKDNTLLTKASLIYTPIKGLELEGTWARETRNPTVKSFIKNVDIYSPNLVTSSYDKIGVWPGNTSLSETFFNNMYRQLLAQASYKFKPIDNLNVKVTAGGMQELFTNSFFSASRQGFTNPNQPYLNLGSGQRDNNAGANELAMVGFFSRANFNYADKYLLELNGRYDGTSRFIGDNQWGFFPSASAGWIFTNESFLKSVDKILRFGKIRGSIGSVGNQNLGNGNAARYPYDAFYGNANYVNPINGTNAYFGNITNLGLALNAFSNPLIKWESLRQANAGIELGFKNGFTVMFDYYVKTHKDLLLQRDIPTLGGGLINPFVNVGDMENKGWELMVNYKTNFKKFNIDVTGMVSDNINKVKALAPGNPFLDGAGATRSAPGFPVGSFFGYIFDGYFADSNAIKGAPVQFGLPWNPTNPASGPKPGDVKYKDLNGDGKIDANDRTFIGNTFPRYDFSINYNMSYQNFDLNIFGQGVGKRLNYLNGTGAIPFSSTDFAASLLAIHKDFWTPSNPNASFPRLLPSGFGGNNFLASNLWFRDASYFRIKNVQLGYKIPANLLSKKLKIQGARVFVSGANLITFTKAWKGFDPEINNANAEFYPLMRTYTAGVNVNF